MKQLRNGNEHTIGKYTIIAALIASATTFGSIYLKHSLNSENKTQSDNHPKRSHISTEPNKVYSEKETKKTTEIKSKISQSSVAGQANAFQEIDRDAKTIMDRVEFDTGSVGFQILSFIRNGFRGKSIFVFRNLTFSTGSANFRSNADEVDNLALILKAYPNIRVSIDGYSDNTGHAESNIQLSQARANSIKARLMGRGILANRIITNGHGSAKSIADNSTAEGRSRNRRIELSIIN
mgnify:CR=1 FL=1